MSISRRNFLRNSALTMGAIGISATNSLSFANNTMATPKILTSPIEKASKPLRILILGGTGFIGPFQVQYALDRGHKVTLFNRGKTNPQLFPTVEKLQGDRKTGDLKSLEGREWDVVIDNPSTLPKWVRDAAQLLKNSAKHYVFISTISVYSDTTKPGMDENTPLAQLTPEVIQLADTNPSALKFEETYGGLKALSEKEAEKAFPNKTTVIRPGLIVGPGDFSDRFSYWPIRIEKGGEILAPGNQDDPVQFIDARDLGEWSIRMAEQEAFGIYNAVGPKTKLSIAEMLYGIKAITTSDARFTWVDTKFLAENKVLPWVDMPVWVPPQGDEAGFTSVSNKRAVEKGLTFRPLADSAKATLEWFKTLPADRQAKLRFGITPERETAVLAAWHKKK